MTHFFSDRNKSEMIVIKYCAWGFYDISFLVTALSALVTRNLWADKYRKR